MFGRILQALGGLFSPRTALILAEGAPGLPAPAAARESAAPGPGTQVALVLAPTLSPGVPSPASSGVPTIAVQLIQEFERCAECRSDGLIYPYRDGGGKATIGWGNTAWESGRAVSMRDAPITQARADALFAHYLVEFVAAVRGVLPPNTSDRDFAAMLSLAWNVGTEAFRTSTAVRRYRAGDRAGALAALQWFNLDNGRVERGLQIRRRAEALVADGAGIREARAQAERDFPRPVLAKR